MNKSWLKYERRTIFRDRSKGGLLSKFLKEYKEYFGGSINPDCKGCRDEYWSNYLNLFKMKEVIKCDYVLKAKYNGIQLGTNGRPVRNGEMTNKIGKELLENHPHGVLLFDEYPKEVVENIKKANELKRAEADRKKIDKDKKRADAKVRKNALKQLTR